MKKLRVISLILLAICILCSIDLGINFFGSTTTEADVLVKSGLLSMVIWGDGGFSLGSFFYAFKLSLYVLASVLVWNIVLAAISIANQQSVSQNRVFRRY